MDVGIDLGTATVIVYIGGEGVVLSEPSVIAVNLKTDSVISVGQEAYEMIGKTPSHIQAIRPLSKGVVCNYKMTEEMVKHFIKKICKDSLIKPRIAMCVPSGITNVESNAVIDVAIASGARKVYLIEEPVAAAIGAQIDIEKPNGNLIVDIGGGTTDIAVLSLNGIVNKKSIKIAGDTINDAIVRYVRNSHGVLIGEKMADQIKRQVAQRLLGGGRGHQRTGQGKKSDPPVCPATLKSAARCCTTASSKRWSRSSLRSRRSSKGPRRSWSATSTPTASP